MNDELLNILNEVLDNWGFETVQAMKRKLASTTPYPTGDTGRLSASLNWKVNDDQTVSFIAADYAKFIDEGTGIFGPDKRKFNIDYPKKLGAILSKSGWATRKNVNPWATARSIYNKGGLKPRKFYNDVIAQRVGNGSLEAALNSAIELWEEAVQRDFEAGR